MGTCTERRYNTYLLALQVAERVVSEHDIIRASTSYEGSIGCKEDLEEFVSHRYRNHIELSVQKEERATLKQSGLLKVTNVDTRSAKGRLSLKMIASKFPKLKLDVNVPIVVERENVEPWKLYMARKQPKMRGFVKDKVGIAFDVKFPEAFINRILATMPPTITPMHPMDLLSEIHQTIPGVNTVFGYLKHDLVATKPHCESAAMGSINVNYGPSTSTWYGAPADQWKTILMMAKEKNIGNPHKDLWFPEADELKERGVDLVEYEQKVGECIYVTPGTVHWVAGNGDATHLSWNLGECSALQFWALANVVLVNTTDAHSSDVPEETLVWTTLMNEKYWRTGEASLEFLETLRTFAAASLIMQKVVHKLFVAANIPYSKPKKEDSEPPRTAVRCEECKAELFFYGFTRGLIRTKKCFECINAAPDDGVIRVRQFRKPLEYMEQFLHFSSTIESLYIEAGILQEN